MTSPVQTIPATADLQEALRSLQAHDVSSLAVVAGKDHRLVGVLSRTDLLAIGRFRAEEEDRNALLKLPHAGLAEVMHRHPICVGPDEPISAAARRMVEHHIHRVFVTEGDRLIGVLSTRDLLPAVAEARIITPISAVMTSEIITVEASDPVSMAVDLIAEEHIRGLVVTENGWPVGLFTQVEALGAQHLAAATPVEEVMSAALLCLPVDTPLHRAAAQMAATRARRVVAVEHRHSRGVLTGMDMACAAM